MNHYAWLESRDDIGPRWLWLQRCWAIFGLFLFGVTWRLWIPQSVFPQVPLVRLAGSMPLACQWAASVAVVVSLLIALTASSRLKGSAQACLFLTFAGALAWLILTDQHRLQPWAYQLLLYAILFATVPTDRSNRARGWALLRLLTLSIYFYSALGKFDYQFLHTVGQQLLASMSGMVGAGSAAWPLALRVPLAGTFPLAELLIAIALAVPRLRRIGVWAAVILHGLLLVVLGPLGLNHEPGVLVWNVFFVAQVLLLFAGGSHQAVPVAEAETSGERSRRPWRPAWLPTGVVLTAVCLPLLEPFGWYDHWPSWGLYSPRNSRAIVEIHQAAIGNLPADLQAYLSHDDADGGWLRLDIDQWSLAALSAPIYPQDRFQLGVAESIAARHHLDRTIRVRLLGMSNRLSGERNEKTLMGRQQIVAAANRFRLNSHPVGSH